MALEDNLGFKLGSFLLEGGVTANEWKLLGQEKDGSLLLTWTEVGAESSNSRFTVIGHYDRISEKLKIFHKFLETINVIQATVNKRHSLLGYVTKGWKQRLDSPSRSSKLVNHTTDSDESQVETETYSTYIVELNSEEAKIHPVGPRRVKQTRIQFLYNQKDHPEFDKFLLLIHQECVLTYTVSYDTSVTTNPVKEIKFESLVGSFIWAQWDPTNQVLYHIHHRRAPTSLVTEDSCENRFKAAGSCPTLSGLQFHDDLPHETVLNIPLNLPELSASSNCGTYEDDVIPLRVRDCSLDLIVVSDPKGMVCVCHYYLYRPVQPPQHLFDIDPLLNDSNTVHFAYSVTLLHHSCVIHCVIPGIQWSRAKLMRPSFTIHDDYMVVLVHDSFTHLLEIGVNHEPCCHILCGPLNTVVPKASYLVPLLDLNPSNKSNAKLTIDLPTLFLIPLTIAPEFLIEVFRNESSLQVRLGILHYFLCHGNDLDTVSELMSIITEKPRTLDLPKFMQEILIGASFSLVQKNLLADAVPLLSLLPVTTLEEFFSYEVKVHGLTVTLSHEKLWNTSVMLLSPQQRLVPYNSDLWTRLWDQLGKRSGDKPRFKPSQVVEKLLVSLACYQPEALSRSSTPMSPGGGLVVTTASLSDLMGPRSNKVMDSNLPFVEVESCTASKQEHIVSVNLRELSMHLLKHGTRTSAIPIQGTCTPLHVHAMATRHVAAQLESSRLLCQILCKAANVDPRVEHERGFVLVDQLDEGRRWLLFMLLERYRHATENSAFPVPQGFTSFFTYLGYRTLKYPLFLQYVQRSVFELQVDVSKIIMGDISDTKENTIKKLRLLSLLPRSRAKRLLNQWLHPVSFMLRAREHATNILSGELCPSRGRTAQHRHHHNGLAAFPTADRLSPLDTFLDLLTAKASLAELDFGLLIEATVTSTEDFL